MAMTEKDALLVLNAIPALTGPRRRELLLHFGTAREIISRSPAQLKSGGLVSDQVCEALTAFPQDEFLKREYLLIKEQGVQVIDAADAPYPVHLKNIVDAPLVLYCHGEVPADNNLSVAVVGSRHATFYGLTMAEKMAGQLAELGLVVVSGMARGIDGAAHQGCLRAGGRTLAVLGCGLSTIYPSEHKDLRKKIARQGAVISEFPMDTQPLRFNFPQRNRIISGIALGVVVVEASLRSGALITSRFAMEQGREVFAVPGPVDSPNSQGTHQLIQQGAKLVCGIQDILEELAAQLKDRPGVLENRDPACSPKKTAAGLCEEERLVYNLIPEERIAMERLQQQYAGPLQSLMNILLQLELKHVIKQLPGKYFSRS